MAKYKRKWEQLRTEVFFFFCTFWTKFCDILKYWNNLKLEIIDYIFRKIFTLNEVNILESLNKYYQKQVYKTSSKKKPFVLLWAKTALRS